MGRHMAKAPKLSHTTRMERTSVYSDDGGSFGLQAGGEATDLVLIATNHDGFQRLLKDKVKLGGELRWRQDHWGATRKLLPPSSQMPPFSPTLAAGAFSPVLILLAMS